ncbi:MAG: TolC family protein [Legionellaceae bacterium]|nr:TolC family protein [Legionellaceae bacterium]
MRYILLALIFCTSTICHAEPNIDLLQAFKDASCNDPVYQQQVAQFNIVKQDVPEKFAALLLQVNLHSAIAKEFHAKGTLPDNGHFNTSSYAISAKQTVFNYTQFSELDQARYNVRAAFATLTAQQQDLMSRTTKAYLDVLQARQLLKFTEEQKEFIQTQLEATTKLFEHREATITDLEQAKGAADLINSDLYTAQIGLYDTIQTLSQITSFQYKKFANLNQEFPLISPNPSNVATWRQSANEKNWLLCAARLNIKFFRYALESVRGGFYPNLAASVEIEHGAVPNQILTDSMTSRDYSYGLTADWQVFQGGLTLAQVKAAKANIIQSEASLQQQYLQTMADTSRAFNTIVVGVPRVKSVRQALSANTKALLFAQESYRSGESTITEILQIQFQLYSAQKQYVEYTYNYLYNIILLKQAQGTLCVNDLAQINSYLV